MMDNNADLLQWFINFLSVTVKNENISDKELDEELHKGIIRECTKIKVYSLFIGNIWGADLADMQWTSKSNKVIFFLMCNWHL